MAKIWTKLVGLTSKAKLGLGVAALVPMLIFAMASDTVTPYESPITPEGEVKDAIVEIKVQEAFEDIPFETIRQQTNNLMKGVEQIKTFGVKGTKQSTYQVTYQNNVMTNSKLVSSIITKPPTDEVILVGTYIKPVYDIPVSQKKLDSPCDPNYSGVCVPIAYDVDCSGSGDNGPAFVKGPFDVIGDDIYGLDYDSNGVACE